jgi:hypothetical protein
MQTRDIRWPGKAFRKDFPHPIAGKHQMESRKTKTLVSIPIPFQLTAMQEQWPPGIYEITTEEEAIGDFMFDAFRRIATKLYLPPRARDFGMGQFVPVNPAELARLMSGAVSAPAKQEAQSKL